MKINENISRRNFLKTSMFVVAQFSLPLVLLPNSAQARTLRRRAMLINPISMNLLDPVSQPKFRESAVNALSPNFRMNNPYGSKLRVIVAQYTHFAGLRSPTGQPLHTPMWGYGKSRRDVSWPGKTIEVFSHKHLKIRWENQLTNRRQPLPHLLPVDDSFHWAYGLHGYKKYSIEKNGVPLVPHVHGSHVASSSDGNPEYFFSPYWRVRGPRWVHKDYHYDNSQKAGCLWYHDHSLGLTRLNVYAGLAGFYIVRDKEDSGYYRNRLGLPANRYELAYAIQDRMFKKTGELFFPAFPNDPAYNDFIFGEGAVLPPAQFPNGGPSILPEFFGDHIVVNGKIWPKNNVEGRHYRIRLLNGCDSRFLAIRFRIASSSTATDLKGASKPIPFWVIGGDQGLGKSATKVTQLLLNPADRPDVVINFADVPHGSRVIMENIAGDAPFDGTLVGDSGFDNANLFPNRQTDRIMAFDVNLKLSKIPDRFDPSRIHHYNGNPNRVDKVRKLALFEGRDEFNRLQPMLGVAEPTLDVAGNLVNGASTWHMPITENPKLGSTEIWEIYNTTVDAHPVHVHLVNFQILNRQKFKAIKVAKKMLQHNGSIGKGFYIKNIQLDPNTLVDAHDVEKAPKDMVTCYPGEVTRIKMTFDRAGRYVWHCHILSHEDHDMMRPLHVGPIPEDDEIVLDGK